MFIGKFCHLKQKFRNKQYMERLFAYGTLKNPLVQKKAIGRVVQGTPDILEGFILSKIKIERKNYPVIIRKNDSKVKGLILSVTVEEVKQIDDYETKAYERQKIILKSGSEAWVYLKPGSV